MPVVCVQALNASRQVVGATAASATTGHYSLTLPVGSYYLRFYGCGEQTSTTHMSELYDDSRRWDGAAMVTVPAGGTVEANAALDLAGGIRGRLVNQFGTGLHCTILSYADATDPLFYDIAATSSTGDFEVRGLVGANRLAADCGPAYGVVAYPDAVTVASPAGADIGSLVVDQPARSVSGTITTDGGGEVGTACIAAVSDAGAIIGLAELGPASHSRPFTRPWLITDLPPGPVKIGLHDCGHGHFEPEWWQDTYDFGSSTDVVVSPSQATSGIAARVTARSTLHMNVRDEAAEPVGGVCAWVTDTGVTTVVNAAYVADGVADVSVVPGVYKVAFTDCGGGWETEWYQDSATAAAATVVVVDETPANITAHLAR